MALESVMVRIAQGAVSNVVRHSGATSLRVTITYAPDRVHLDIVDNGTGFDVEDAQAFGLATIRRRAEELDGQLDITSEPGNTSVAGAFPICSPDESVDIEPMESDSAAWRVRYDRG